MIESKYKVLLWFIGAEFVLLGVLNKCGISIEPLGARIIGLFAAMFPIELLLFKLGKDEQHSEKKRFFFKVFFWFIILCCVGGVIATLIL